MMNPSSSCRCMAWTKQTAKEPKIRGKPAPKELYKILMPGEGEVSDAGANREEVEGQVSFEDHTSMSLDEEGTETNMESLGDDENETESEEEGKGDSSVGNVIGNILAEMSPLDVDLVSDLEVSQVNFTKAEILHLQRKFLSARSESRGLGGPGCDWA